MTPDEARTLALAWRGDTFSVLRLTDPVHSSVVTAGVWTAEFASDAAAASVASHVGFGAARASGTRLVVAAHDGVADLSWALPPQ